MNKSDFCQIIIDAPTNSDIITDLFKEFIVVDDSNVTIIPFIDRNAKQINLDSTRTIETSVKQIQESVPKEQLELALLRAAVFYSIANKLELFTNYSLGIFNGTIGKKLKNFLSNILKKDLNPLFKTNLSLQLDLENCLLRRDLREFIKFTGDQLKILVQIVNLNPLCYKVIATDVTLWDNIQLVMKSEDLKKISPYFYIKLDRETKNNSDVSTVTSDFAELIFKHVNEASVNAFFKEFTDEIIQLHLLVDKELRNDVLYKIHAMPDKDFSLLEKFLILKWILSTEDLQLGNTKNGINGKEEESAPTRVIHNENIILPNFPPPPPPSPTANSTQNTEASTESSEKVVELNAGREIKASHRVFKVDSNFLSASSFDAPPPPSSIEQHSNKPNSKDDFRTGGLLKALEERKNKLKPKTPVPVSEPSEVMKEPETLTFAQIKGKMEDTSYNSSIDHTQKNQFKSVFIPTSIEKRPTTQNLGRSNLSIDLNKFFGTSGNSGSQLDSALLSFKRYLGINPIPNNNDGMIGECFRSFINSIISNQDFLTHSKELSEIRRNQARNTTNFPNPNTPRDTNLAQKLRENHTTTENWLKAFITEQYIKFRNELNKDQKLVFTQRLGVQFQENVPAKGFTDRETELLTFLTGHFLRKDNQLLETVLKNFALPVVEKTSTLTL